MHFGKFVRSISCLELDEGIGTSNLELGRKTESSRKQLAWLCPKQPAEVLEGVLLILDQARLAVSPCFLSTCYPIFWTNSCESV